MKKIFAMLLAAGSLMCFAAGCGDDGSDEDSDKRPAKDNFSSSVEVDDAYVNKSKIASANSAASSLSKAGSSAMLDLEDKYDENVSGTYWLTGKNIGASGKTLSYGSEMKIKGLDKLSEIISDYFSDITKVEEAGIYFKDGTAVGSYCKMSTGYFGTYPSDLFSESDYMYNPPTLDECITEIEKKFS